MAQFAIQHASEIQDGPTYLVKASHLIDNFNAIIDDFDDRLSLISTTPQTVLGTLTFNSGLNTDSIGEKTTNLGVTIDSVLLKDGMAKLSGTPTVAGQIGYAGNQFQGYRNATLKNFLMSGDATALPTSYINGLVPKFTSTTSITIPANLKARDGTDVSDITILSDIVISTATSGAAGLDTGTVANNTWYYAYLLQNPSNNTSSALISAVNESVSGSITLPSGYTLKRQLPIAIRTNGSAQIIPFYVANGWPFRPLINYRVTFTANAGSITGTTQVLNAGSATSFTDIALSSFVPPISKLANIKYSAGAGEYVFIQKGDTSNGLSIGNGTANNTSYAPFLLETDATQTIQYKRTLGSASVSMDVAGFVVTEVA